MWCTRVCALKQTNKQLKIQNIIPQLFYTVCAKDRVTVAAVENEKKGYLKGREIYQTTWHFCSEETQKKKPKPTKQKKKKKETKHPKRNPVQEVHWCTQIN